jgi:hypothetical protein
MTAFKRYGVKPSDKGNVHNEAFSPLNLSLAE